MIWLDEEDYKAHYKLYDWKELKELIPKLYKRLWVIRSKILAYKIKNDLEYQSIEYHNFKGVQVYQLAESVAKLQIMIRNHKKELEKLEGMSKFERIKKRILKR